MKISVRQLKGLIREAISEAHDDMTGYEIDPGDNRGQLVGLGRSSKKMFLLTAGRGHQPIGLFPTKSAAEAAAEKYLGKTFTYIEAITVEPSPAEMKKMVVDMQYGGNY